MRPPSETSRKRQGRYELGELLGRGGMAEVFAGHSMGDHGFSKPVAIKRLLPELANDHVFVERLIGEAKLLVGMQHGNIVSVLDLAREDDDVFLVMEYVDGPSLRQLLKGRGSRGLSLGVSSYIIAAAAAGLEFAHGRSVIHADISPSNLLLTTSGEVRVADFGIARREGGTSHGVEGKWAYMAPEQARGEPLTPSSDVFALGVVIYELLTGMHPFGRQVTADDRSSEPLRVIPPRVVKPSVPVGLDAICMRCLALDSRDRYARMHDVIEAITDERFTNGYREGANDLAQAIREIQGFAQPPPLPVQTQANRPVTIVTRSLLSQPKRLAQLGMIASAPTAHLEAATFARGTSARGSSSALQQSTSNPNSMLGAEPAVAAAVAPVPRKSRWAFIIVGMAAVLGAIAAITIQLAPGGGLEPSKSPVVATATQSALVQPITTEPAAKVVPAPAPVEATLPAEPVPPPKPVKVEAPTIARPAFVAPRKKEMGTFRLSTTTWAYASIDGGPQQEVSMIRKFPLAVGKHTVRIFNPDLGLKSVTRSVVIEANKSRVWKVDLESGSVKEID